MILARILDAKRKEVERRRRERPLAELEAASREAPPPRSLRSALAAREEGPRVIAEVKKSSPSRGVIRADFDPVGIARAYERAGAAAISVLTDEEFFGGRLEDLAAVRRAVALPLLRKDFIIDPYQLLEARCAGADAALLILTAAGDELLQELAERAAELGMDVLWEVHDLAEARRLERLPVRIAGINNRDLETFEVSLETTRRLIGELPARSLAVSESGFSRPDELRAMEAWGVGAFLIGESLMRAPDPGAALRELLAATAAGPGGVAGAGGRGAGGGEERAGR